MIASKFQYFSDIKQLPYLGGDADFLGATTI